MFHTSASFGIFTVCSEEGNGLMFVIHLMIKREIEFEREMHHFLPKLVCSHSEKEKAKRLIIDDCRHTCVK